MLENYGITIAITTYQAGKLVFLRAERSEGTPVVNTHFRHFGRPMGFAWEPGRFSLGTTSEIWEFHDIPAAARKLDSASSKRLHDAAYLPRHCHFTGDIQIHEMAWVPVVPVAGGARSPEPSRLWFINTRFSCLATRSNQYSFEPKWKPSFITAFAPQDRCHLNGMCIRDGIVRYVTALGESDAPGGWREEKGSGGILIDVKSDEIIARGLSMPHSPRWHDGKLWVLESGVGGVGIIDPSTGRYQEVCRLPGFTRGLDFDGPYAFVGLSQVRESATFSGIAIAERPQNERCCGVWMIDTRSGQIAGFVKFTDALQEIFAVQVLAGVRWPDVLSENQERIADTYELSNEVLQQVPAELRESSGQLPGRTHAI
jgi:uncharacterized protein (TIGR03032 family)